MLVKSKFSLFNQSFDLYLKKPEDENLAKSLKNCYRKTLFESEGFLLEETREKTMGIYVGNEGAGTTLYQQEEEWTINFGFGKMELIEIEDMVSIFKPLESVLEHFKGDLAISLKYFLENHEKPSEEGNAFLREVVLNPPVTLVDDEMPRVFKIERSQEVTVFSFKSLNKDLLALEKGVSLLQKEKVNAENVFLISLHSWLNSIKRPRLVCGLDIKGMNCSNNVARNNSSH